MKNPMTGMVSYLLLLKASRCQVRGQFENVIMLSQRAKTLDPTSLMAFVLLGYGYRGLKKYEDAKRVLSEALTLYPDDESLNKLFVDVLIEKGEPIQHIIPYIRTYLTHRPRQKGRFPVWMKILTKFFRKHIDLDVYSDDLYKKDTEWAQWAQHTVTQYEQKTSDIERREI